MRKVNSEFAGLKSKMYSLIDVGNKENSKATGVNINKRHKNILMFCLIKKNNKRHNEKNSKSFA